ncbi:hypothetical protein ACO0LC_18675 [Undibacterium sp. JH2W]|uniref:hypothetical protein n=1 Tax=Undibacterium sp. JH2W TaxID=3413037 RepID=UPI003BF1CB4C
MKSYLVFLCFLLGVNVVQAQTKAVDSTCEQLSIAVEGGVKELAYYEMTGILDNSAPRETNRKLNQVLQMGAIQANLLLMQANKCVLPKLPISETAYRANALQCELASGRASRSKEGNTPLAECDRAAWSRSYVYSKSP